MQISDNKAKEVVRTVLIICKTSQMSASHRHPTMQTLSTFKLLLRVFLFTFAGLGLTEAHAFTITGSLFLTPAAGTAVTVDFDLNQVTFSNSGLMVASAASGQFQSLVGAAFTQSNFQYDPLSVERGKLWESNAGVIPSTWFTLTTITYLDEQPGSYLTVGGRGILTMDGYDPTAGSWYFFANASGQAARFDWRSTTTVPDSAGMPALLILAAGVLLLTRRLIRA